MKATRMMKFYGLLICTIWGFFLGMMIYQGYMDDTTAILTKWLYRLPGLAVAAVGVFSGIRVAMLKREGVLISAVLLVFLAAVIAIMLINLSHADPKACAVAAGIWIPVLLVYGVALLSISRQRKTQREV